MIHVVHNSRSRADFIEAVVGLMERGDTPGGDILVERVYPLRFAQVDDYAAMFDRLNGSR